MPNKKYPPIKNQYFFFGSIVASVLVLSFIFVSFTQDKKTSEPVSTDRVNSGDRYLPTKTSDNEIGAIMETSRDGWKKYVNKQANFTIEYPENLIVVEEHEFRTDSAPQQGKVIFCTKQIKKNNDDCEVGLRVFYGVPIGDGWGGGCEPSDHKKIVFTGKQTDVCESSDYISQLYATHPQKKSEVSLSANLGESFTEIEAKQAIKSFAFNAVD